MVAAGWLLMGANRKETETKPKPTQPKKPKDNVSLIMMPREEEQKITTNQTQEKHEPKN
jgi:hypothetical protein